MGSDRIQFRDPDNNIKQKLAAIEQNRGHDNQSEALRELVDAGYREIKNPILYRLKYAGVLGGFVFVLLGVSTLPFGYLTGVFDPGTAWYLLASFFALGAFWLSLVEVIRWIGSVL